MKKLQVFGPGCARCNRLADLTDRAAREIGLAFTLEKVKDFTAIADMGIVVTPALAVDGEVKLSGRVPTLEELKGILGETS
jgi:small redox-active disulfide protein 2